MIRVATEQVVALGRAGKHFPRRRGDKRPHPATIYRWAKFGVRSDDGSLVCLDSSLTVPNCIFLLCNELTHQPEGVALCSAPPSGAVGLAC